MLEPAIHGGAPPGLIDFSTGVSPLEPPEAVLRAVASAELRRYPPPTGAPLRERLSALHDVAPERIVVGAGSTELIWALARAGAAGREVAYPAHGFAEYRQAALAAGATPRPFGTPDEVPPCALAFVGRPDSATLEAPDPRPLAEGRPSTLVVADEAYQPLVDGLASLPASGNLAVLRSLTKVFALPGLRLGYLVAAPEIARVVQAALPPWNVSAPAIAGGLAALDEPIGPVRAAVRALRCRLATGLRQRGFTVAGEDGPFVLLAVPDAARLTAELRVRGIAVRDCSSFGLPGRVRLGARPAEEQDRLLTALAELTP
jgi:histidinol-phosphate/aromatic aminotransferase/cobyric acid decarboxylase-like protein